MALKIGIVGLPNVGKSTLFNALLKKQVAVSANYPFTTIEPNVGVVEVPDERLEKLADVISRDSSSETQNDKRVWVNGKPPIVHATVEFVDIAGLVKGAHKGEGLGNQFLSHIREVDAIVFVIRDFKSEDIIKTGENPKDDLEVLKSELLLKDLETVETQNSKLKTPNSNLKSTLEKLQENLGKGIMASDIEFDNQGQIELNNLNFLTAKKYIVVVNSDENQLGIESQIGGGIRISAKMEEELAGLDENEQKEYLKEVGVSESGLEKLIKKAYEVLGLETFLTAGPKEVRAWTIKKGSFAPQAAGVIHTDFERGFIAADVIPFDKFVEVGGWKAARDRGVVKTIGKGEIMPTNCVVEFKFNV